MTNNLNPIKITKGPCVILAGAGTGKTYTIVEKVKYFIENSTYSPQRIVCITFSNEAANNLSIRVEKAIGITKEKPIIRTFHGFSADLLRLYGGKIGISKEFKILDPEQAMILIHRNLRVPALNCRRYIETIGTAKDLGISIEEFKNYLEKELQKTTHADIQQKLEDLQFEFQTLHLKSSDKKKTELLKEIKKLKRILDIKKFANAWNAYEKIKQKGNYQDYSDLNKNALLLLEKAPEVASNYDYFIIDEFQDTNKVQLDFLIKISSHKNITIVGDMNQSIYRFRGAYRENLAIFKSAFNVKDNEIFNLDKSYRSSNKILRTAHKLILNNYSDKEECFFVDNVHNREGMQLEVYELVNAKEEARKVVEIVKEEIAKTPLEEICVLFRAHQYGRIIKRALEQEGIAYSSVSKASLFRQKSIKITIGYLNIVNKMKKKLAGGEHEWWDLAYQSELSNEDLVKIGRAIKEFSNKNKNNSESIENEKTLSEYLINAPELRLSERGKIIFKSITEKVRMILEHADGKISEFIQEVYRVSGLINEQKTKEEKEAMLNMNKFYEIAKQHEELYDSELGNFLFYLKILNELGIEIEAASLEEAGVRLMSCHATKGLEYKVVIITNMAQGRFPIERYFGNSLIPTELMPEIKPYIAKMSEYEKERFVKEYESHHQLLEERRLAYVSFTRTKERLVLTYAKEYAEKKAFASQFLDEIEFMKNKELNFISDNEKKFVEKESKIAPANFYTAISSPENEIDKIAENREIKKEHGKFSPSALNLFDECQKQFEYKYVLNMPERKTISWEAMRLGSFVHSVLDEGVSSQFKKIDDFLILTREMALGEEWQGIELQEAETLIKVFFERNKNKYNEKSMTEQYLSIVLDGMEFIGYADRIDFTENNEAEIIDYKTGKSSIPPRNREWQLGFYALAAKQIYGKVKRVTLDMLKQEKPFEFEIDEKGNAICRSSEWLKPFNIYEVEEQLIKTAKRIQEAYKQGFKPCPIEKNCDFCNEYVYGL